MLRGKLGDSVYIHHHYIGQKLVVFFGFFEDSKAISLIEDIIQCISEQSGSIIYCGLSCRIKYFTDIHDAYKNAEKAVHIASQNPDTNLMIYEKLALEIILSQLTPDSVHNYIFNVFKTRDDKKIKEIISFLNIYFEENGSLNSIAERLFVHKNTVQYKIKKIIDQTGYDPRKSEDGLVFLLACKLVKKMEEI